MAADTLSRIFSALADPTRRDMVDRLSTADATVNQLAARYEMSLQSRSGGGGGMQAAAARAVHLASLQSYRERVYQLGKWLLRLLKERSPALTVGIGTLRLCCGLSRMDASCVHRVSWPKYNQRGKRGETSPFNELGALLPQAPAAVGLSGPI